MLTDDGRKHAVEACRQWAKIRDFTMVAVAASTPRVSDEALDTLREFDAQMFRLGGQVFAAEGEVTRL